MKKNFISVGILALLIVNIALTAVMMFSVMSTNKKTAALITDIATAIDLELVAETPEEETTETISMADVDTYTITEMTIPLRNGLNPDGTPDTKDHYAVVTLSLSMNKLHPDYEVYGADIANKEDLIKGQINQVVSGYTIDEAKADSYGICQEILAKLQELYGSDFIFNVTFSSSVFA